MDTAQWDIVEVGLVKPMDEAAPSAGSKPMMLDKKVKPQKDQALNCPRCNSTNTKFCYFNNYSLTQPRYFCKTCRRYWTEGGSLRNVPVGGGSRKNKRSTSSSSTSTATPHKLPDLNPPSLSNFSSHNPKTYEGQDLNLAFTAMQDYLSISQFVELPKVQNINSNHYKSSSCSSTSTPALELLSTGTAYRGLNSFIPTPAMDSNTLYASGSPFQELKPNTSFPVDGFGSRYVSLQGVQENSGRLMFPFGVGKQFSSISTEVDQNKEQGSSTGHWNGMLGGGSW